MPYSFLVLLDPFLQEKEAEEGREEKRGVRIHGYAKIMCHAVDMDSRKLYAGELIVRMNPIYIGDISNYCLKRRAHKTKNIRIAYVESE